MFEGLRRVRQRAAQKVRARLGKGGEWSERAFEAETMEQLELYYQGYVKHMRSEFPKMIDAMRFMAATSVQVLAETRADASAEIGERERAAVEQIQEFVKELCAEVHEKVMEPFNAWSTRLIELKKMIEHERAMRLDCDIYQREVEAFQERFAPVEGVAREAPMTPEELGMVEAKRQRVAEQAKSIQNYQIKMRECLARLLGERQQLDECTGIMLQMQTVFHNRMADMVAELHKAVVGSNRMQSPRSPPPSSLRPTPEGETVDPAPQEGDEEAVAEDEQPGTAVVEQTPAVAPSEAAMLASHQQQLDEILDSPDVVPFSKLSIDQNTPPSGQVFSFLEEDGGHSKEPVPPADESAAAPLTYQDEDDIDFEAELNQELQSRESEQS